MVSCVVEEDTGNRTLEEEIMSGSEGPDVSQATHLSGDACQCRSWATWSPNQTECEP